MLDKQGQTVTAHREPQPLTEIHLSNYLNAVVTTIQMQLCYKQRVQYVVSMYIIKAWPTLVRLAFAEI